MGSLLYIFLKKNVKLQTQETNIYPSKWQKGNNEDSLSIFIWKTAEML
jgi:hypothetical protein